VQPIRQKWDRIYSQADLTLVPEPCYVLKQYNHLLPESGQPAIGTALDIASGLGGNALYLANRGFNTTAIDISSVAIEIIRGYNHPMIDACCAPISSDELERVQYDIVVVANFLDRALCSAIGNAVSPGGLLFYQTHVKDKANPERGPSNPEFLLVRNELLSLFAGFDVLAFSDIGRAGELETGFRNQSYLVARRNS